MNLSAFNSPNRSARDLYVGVVLPDGSRVVYFTGPNVIGPGVYTWFAVLVSPGALADGFPQPGDVDVLALRAITLRP